MIYEFMRFMAGDLACYISDLYNQYQFGLNLVIIVTGFIWIAYKKKNEEEVNVQDIERG